MIMIFGALVSKDDISRYFFSFCFSIFIFQVVKGVTRQKVIQNTKKILSVMLQISRTIHHIIVIYGGNV